MRKITIGLLVFPRFQMLDLAGPGDALAEVGVLGGGAGDYDIVTVASTRGAVQASNGVTIVPQRTIFDPCPHFDTVIVPGGPGVFDMLEDTTVSDWLAAQGDRCRRIGAVGNGVFALGAAGLIGGKTVTTHWIDAARLAAMFGSAVVEADRLHVRDGALHTTAGATAGIDLALALIEEDFGRKMALAVAKYLIVHLRRAGGQSQFGTLLEAQGRNDTPVAAVQNYVLAHLDLDHTLASIAAHMRMSERNLSRLFKRQTGMTLMAYVSDARIEAARRHLEASGRGLDDIARRCGFGTPSVLRRVFARRLGIGPAEYRARFHADRPG